jgi:hypothetical protein
MNFYQLFNEQIEDFSQQRLMDARSGLKAASWLAEDQS